MSEPSDLNSENMSNAEKLDDDDKESQMDHLNVQDHEFNETQNQMFDSNYIRDDLQLLNDDNDMSMDSVFDKNNETHEDAKIILTDRTFEGKQMSKQQRAKDTINEENYEGELHPSQPSMPLDLRIGREQFATHIKDDESSDGENEIPAVANLPQPKSKVSSKKTKLRVNKEVKDEFEAQQDSSDSGNEIEAVPIQKKNADKKKKVKKSPKPVKEPLFEPEKEVALESDNENEVKPELESMHEAVSEHELKFHAEPIIKKDSGSENEIEVIPNTSLNTSKNKIKKIENLESDGENEIPAVAYTPKQVKNIKLAQDLNDSRSSDGNEIDAVPQSEPKEENKQYSESESDEGNINSLMLNS